MLPQIHPFSGFCGSKSMSKRMGASVAIGRSTCCQLPALFALAACGRKEPEAAAAAAAADALCIISRRLTPSADITAPRSEPVRAARPAGAPEKAAPAAHKQPPTAKTMASSGDTTPRESFRGRFVICDCRYAGYSEGWLAHATHATTRPPAAILYDLESRGVGDESAARVRGSRLVGCCGRLDKCISRAALAFDYLVST